MSVASLSSTASSSRSHSAYPAYKQSGIPWMGDIPSHWNVTRLKYIARLAYGDSLAGDFRQDGDVPVFGSNGVVGSHVCANTYGPALVIGRKGSFGKVNYSDQPCFAIDTTYFIDIRTTKADLRWLFYLLSSLNLDALSRDTGVPGLAREAAHVQAVPVTPLVEQRAIAAFLDRETAKIDALIAKKERLIEVLEEKRFTLIDQAVTKGLDSNDAYENSSLTGLDRLPTHWRLQRLKTVISYITSGSRGWAEYYSDEGPNFLRIGNLSRTSIHLDLAKDIQNVKPPRGVEGERTRVHGGDVLVSITAYIGSIAIAPDHIGEAYINQHIALVRPLNTITTPKWLGYCLFSKIGQHQLTISLSGGTKDGLGLDDVKNVYVPIPPLEEQATIVAHLENKVSTIDALIVKVREHIGRLREHRTSLISAAVTGKIDVREDLR